MTRILRERETHAHSPKPTPCPVEALAREHKRLAEIHSGTPSNSVPGVDYDALGHRIRLIEQAAASLRARSPGGAIFQVMLAKGLVEELEDRLALDEDANAIVLRLFSALYSTVGVLEDLSGEDRSAFSGDYGMPSDSDPHTLADRLPPAPNS